MTRVLARIVVALSVSWAGVRLVAAVAGWSLGTALVGVLVVVAAIVLLFGWTWIDDRRLMKEHVQSRLEHDRPPVPITGDLVSQLRSLETELRNHSDRLSDFVSDVEYAYSHGIQSMDEGVTNVLSDAVRAGNAVQRDLERVREVARSAYERVPNGASDEGLGAAAVSGAVQAGGRTRTRARRSPEGVGV